MIGAALMAINSEVEVEPFIVAQTPAGNWVWLDENDGSHGVLTPAELERDYEVVDVLPADLVAESLENFPADALAEYMSR